MTTNDFLVYVTPDELKHTVKPMVLFMQERLQILYPEQDFTFMPDEFVRDQPADYELKIAWYSTEAFGPKSYISYVITRLELIWPEKIQRNILNYTTGVADCPTFRNELIKLLVRQREAMDAGFFERLKSYELRLTW